MYSREEIVKPFWFQGNEVGILLIHGFTACPADLRPLGEILHDYGYTVAAPLLAGHGTTPELMQKTSWEDWLSSAEESLNELHRKCSQVVAVGHSVGGLIALTLAAERKVDGVVSINAPVIFQNKEIALADKLLGKIEYVEKSYKTDQNEISINSQGLPHFSYQKVPLKCLVAVTRAITDIQKLLPRIECPALIIQSNEDKTVNPESAKKIAEGIVNTYKKLVYWEKEDHYLPLSADRAELAAEIEKFCRSTLYPERTDSTC